MDKETCREGNKLLMDIKDLDIQTSTHVCYNLIKQTFYRCMQDAKKFSDAINLRPQIIRSAICSSKLTTLKTPGINPYTQVELHEKFGPCLPPDESAITCPKPSGNIYKMVKREARDRKSLKMELIQRKKKVYEQLELIAYGNDNGCEVKGEEEGELV